MRVGNRLLGTTAMIACLSVAGAVYAGPVTIINTEVDVIPNGASAETQQNSEPSIAVNPNNQSQLISGAFTGIFSAAPVNLTTPYWISANGGTTWSSFGSLQTLDKSLAWQAGDANPLTATLHGISTAAPFNNDIQTFGSTNGTSFNQTKNTFSPPAALDQPWIRTGPSSVGPAQNVYVAYNNLSNFGTAAGQGHTASVNVSTNDGTAYTTKVIETVTPGAGQDSPAVREAVNGGTVYAMFTRWNTTVSTSTQGTRFGSDVIVVKSTDFGNTFSAGTRVNASLNSVTAPFTACPMTGCVLNTPLTLGAERVGSDNAIAVSRTDVNRIVVAYVDSPALGQMQVVVSESTNGGTSFTEKFRTPLATRSAEPAVTILDDGQIVLLYNNYNPQTDKLSQHLVATSDHFASTTDTVLATENNDTSGGPAVQFSPYVGDFFDLTSIGDTFYGIFSASNADNGTLASYLFNSPPLFQRCFTGTPGTGTFALCDNLGGTPGFSIDPIFFSGTSFASVPEPGSLALLGTSLLGLAALRRRRK